MKRSDKERNEEWYFSFRSDKELKGVEREMEEWEEGRKNEKK